MSAICGVFYNSVQADFADAEAMMNELGHHRFDVSHNLQDDKIFLGCHLNRIVPESVNEILPYRDLESLLVITADAIIDNRTELLTALNLAAESLSMPDSFFILQAYKKWGKNCPEKLAGDFAFAIWDEEKQELFCARDHVGKRVLYYYYSPELFAFSTLIKPLFNITAIKKQINDVYAADFLALTAERNMIEPQNTIYANIFQLLPAHAMVINAGGHKLWQYWEIKKDRPVRFKTDAEYEAAFQEIFFEAVKCRLRSIKRVGVMLSGGLDSSSVACIAAAELKKKNEPLYGYTQVPMEGYKDWLPSHRLADERAYVDEICRFSGNIVSSYITSEEKTPFTEIDFKIAAAEQPYKTIENSYWMNEILRRAAADDIGVLMDGQSGNATISWGNWDAYTRYLIKSGRLIILMHELKKQARIRETKISRLLLSMIFSFFPYRMKLHRYIKMDGQNFLETLSPINPDFYRAMDLEKRFAEHKVDLFMIDKGDSFEQRCKLLSPAALSHLGTMETKMPMDFGLVRRDPTRDKRLIEFCMNIPEDQWVRNSVGRRLIRLAMRDYIPDMVRLNTAVKGHQAADWKQRIEPEWQQIHAEMATIGDGKLERKFLDIEKIKQKLAETRDIEDRQGHDPDIRFLLRALVFTRFLRANFED